MIPLAVILFVLCGLFLALAGMFGAFCRLFEAPKKDAIGRVSAFLVSQKHQKDVPVYGKNYHGPVTVTIIKNRCRAVYEYTVGGKVYRIRHTLYVTARQMPRTVGVVYWKRFPRIRYVRDEVGSHSFDLAAILNLIFAGAALILALTALFI